MSVDERDAELTRFATHLAVILDRVAPGSGPRFRVAHRARPFGPPELGEAFGEALYDLEQDVLLVLDDFHAAASETVSAFVGGLLIAAPRRLHMIFCTRKDPPSPCLVSGPRAKWRS